MKAWLRRTLGPRWMIVADDAPGVTYDLGWHYWLRSVAEREAAERNARLRSRYGTRNDTVWRLARVGDYPDWRDPEVQKQALREEILRRAEQ